MLKRIANAMADSAAAIVITKRAKTCPFNSWESRKVEKDTKLILIAFSNNSSDIKIRTTFLLVKNP